LLLVLHAPTVVPSSVSLTTMSTLVKDVPFIPLHNSNTPDMTSTIDPSKLVVRNASLPKMVTSSHQHLQRTPVHFHATTHG
jgi:hypothetical protein